MQKFTVIYQGGDANRHLIDLYDASESYKGLARTLSLIGHYYVTGDVIFQATSSRLPLYLSESNAGSFKQNILAGVVTGVIGIPITFFGQRMLEAWMPPSPDPQMEQIVELLKEQNAILRDGVTPAQSETEEQDTIFDKFYQENQKDLLKLRSAASESFEKIFRPIKTGSVERIGLATNSSAVPRIAVDRISLNQLTNRNLDDEIVTVKAVVNSFSRSSKSGFMFSHEMRKGFRFEFASVDQLERKDIFSWSQFEQQPLLMSGRFDRYHDHRIRHFVIYTAKKIEDAVERDEYWNN